MTTCKEIIRQLGTVPYNAGEGEYWKHKAQAARRVIELKRIRTLGGFGARGVDIWGARC